MLYTSGVLIVFLPPILLLLESLHDSRPMLGAGSCSRVELSSRSSRVHGCGRMGQTNRCFIVCSSPHSYAVCPSSLYPHFCVMALHHPVPFRRRLRLDQVGPASFRRGGSDSSGLKPPIMYWYLANNMTLVFDRCKHQLLTAIKLLILFIQFSI